jgi:hypothetical protein
MVDRIITLSRMKAAYVALASHGAPHHAWRMFVITEDDAAAIRAVFNQEGELSAVTEEQSVGEVLRWGFHRKLRRCVKGRIRPHRHGNAFLIVSRRTSTVSFDQSR